ncbi:MAG: (4Fe-4S)-binding protein [Candidatus Kapabacteria bacterium]|nr:(4Fe-4S)-binding protein [Candidatus Kapabacteria bacterium]
MADVVKNYTNGEITVVWQPDKCVHSANCFRNLPSVFNPRINPWIQPHNADSAETIAVVLGCPSGALTLAPPSNPSAD